MKIHWYGIDWGPSGDDYFYYWWNWLEKDARYLGRHDMILDTVYASYGLWYINLSWSTPWTKFRKQ